MLNTKLLGQPLGGALLAVKSKVKTLMVLKDTLLMTRSQLLKGLKSKLKTTEE
jgi:hypothetical protein